MPTNTTTVRLNINKDHGSIEESTQDDTRIPIMISGLRGCFRPQLFMHICRGHVPSSTFESLFVSRFVHGGEGANPEHALKLKPQTLCPKP